MAALVLGSRPSASTVLRQTKRQLPSWPPAIDTAPNGPDVRDIVSGRAIFSSDVRLPDLLYCVIARPPVLGQRLGHVDAFDALGVHGVVRVIPLAPSRAAATGLPLLGGVAVLAESSFAALRGRDALRIVWEQSSPAVEPSDEPSTIDYFVPDFSRTPTAMPGATARVRGGTCSIWAAIDDQDSTRRDIAGCLGLASEDVVLVNLSLGATTRGAKPTYAIEAAMLSKEMGGRPVSLRWTREDDIPFRRWRMSSSDDCEPLPGADEPSLSGLRWPKDHPLWD